ncbi:MAG: hypothetical protein PHR96_02900 [Clostridia bacterium]|nr:hypothetical protein [Clostridia bacterium]
MSCFYYTSLIRRRKWLLAKPKAQVVQGSGQIICPLPCTTFGNRLQRLPIYAGGV